MLLKRRFFEGLPHKRPICFSGEAVEQHPPYPVQWISDDSSPGIM
jgi:hypothetical protein